MNSRDPWAVILTDAYGDVVHPRPHYGHPFYREVPSWIHYDDPDIGGTTRQLFDGAFIGNWADDDDGATTGANMTKNIGAELTALSVPGYGYPFGPYYRPYGGPYGGVFFGAEAPPAAPSIPAALAEPPRRRGLTAELAPILAPATGGVSVKKHLDDKHVLHVEICVDGKCYSTSMDLAPAIAMIMQKLTTWHDQMHAPQPPPPTVVSTVQSAVGAAEELIVGALVARHIDTVAAGFLGDIAGAVKGAARGLAGAAGGLASGVRSTFRKLKGPIGTAAAIAAASGAAAIPGVGPIAAPLASKIANDLVQAAAGDAKAQQTVAQVSQQAQTDPATAAALDQATKAVANSTAAYHVQDTAKKAARGDSESQQQIAQVATDAEQGDPAAKAVADLVANAMKSEWGAKLWEQVTGRGPATVSPTLPTAPTATSGWYDVASVGRWYDVVGAALDDVREEARTHANTKAGNAAGVMKTIDGRLHGRGFRSLDDAIDWLQRVARNRQIFTYAAVYEKAADGTAYIQDEEFGATSQPAPSTPIPRGGPAMTMGW